MTAFKLGTEQLSCSLRSSTKSCFLSATHTNSNTSTHTHICVQQWLMYLCVSESSSYARAPVCRYLLMLLLAWSCPHLHPACRLLLAPCCLPACFRWQNVIVSCGSLFVCLLLAHFGLSACQLLPHKQVADRVLASHLKALTAACVQLCCANSTMAATPLSPPLSFFLSLCLSVCLARSINYFATHQIF